MDMDPDRAYAVELAALGFAPERIMPVLPAPERAICYTAPRPAQAWAV
jgi:hypothetical protein